MAWDAKVGKRVRKTFATRSAAKQWRHDTIAGLRAGVMSAGHGPLLSEAVERWLTDSRSGVIRNRSGDVYKAAAIAAYRRNLRLRVLPVFGDKRLGEITTREVQQLVDGLIRNDLAPATIDSALTPLKALYRWEDRSLSVLMLHEARHNYASFAIAAGLNAKTLSTYMGHANIAITLDLYGHLMPGSEDESTGLLDAYFARSIHATAARTAAHRAEMTS